VAKGYIIDRVMAVLEDRGFTDCFASIGGDIAFSGKKGDHLWSVGVQDPDGRRGDLLATMTLTDAAVATSGDYERAFTVDGRRYHHIIDPATGYPSRSGSRGVTLIAPSAMLADGLATAVFVLGPERGVELIESLPATEAIIIDDGEKRWITSGLEGKVQWLDGSEE